MSHHKRTQSRRPSATPSRRDFLKGAANGFAMLPLAQLLGEGSATGGAQSKKSPLKCSSDCLKGGEGVDMMDCYYTHFGRLVAIGMVSAVVAGMKVVPVKCDESGDIDLEDLKTQIAKHAPAMISKFLRHP